MRGKPLSDYDGSGTNGITPADAGKTQTVKLSLYFIEDHPRGCGENWVLRHPHSCSMGSPPRMRGKLSAYAQTVQLQGITPADAGKTLSLLFIIFIKQDHPRGCGENFGEVSVSSSGAGSPPRMRGKLYLPVGGSRYKGITPADAGKTICAYSNHVMGAGSPPRMRGKLGQKTPAIIIVGITPADAGKTQTLIYLVPLP